eukprot:758241-Hanusia_phi.AAC.3
MLVASLTFGTGRGRCNLTSDVCVRQLYSNKWWEYLVLLACFCHSLTIFWESRMLIVFVDLGLRHVTVNHSDSQSFDFVELSQSRLSCGRKPDSSWRLLPLLVPLLSD